MTCEQQFICCPALCHLLLPLICFAAFRYVDENGLLQPPMWRATEGAQNIVDVVNEYYNNTGIQ